MSSCGWPWYKSGGAGKGEPPLGTSRVLVPRVGAADSHPSCGEHCASRGTWKKSNNMQEGAGTGGVQGGTHTAGKGCLVDHQLTCGARSGGRDYSAGTGYCVSKYRPQSGYHGVTEVAKTTNMAKMAEKCIHCSARPTLPHTNPMVLGPRNSFSAQNRKKPKDS